MSLDDIWKSLSRSLIKCIETNLSWQIISYSQYQDSIDALSLKLLRWVSEIVSDGSEIRSLAGRSARLGDGTSRNPPDRDSLMEVRTKDLAGMIGLAHACAGDGGGSDDRSVNSSALPIHLPMMLHYFHPEKVASN